MGYGDVAVRVDVVGNGVVEDRARIGASRAASGTMPRHATYPRGTAARPATTRPRLRADAVCADEGVGRTGAANGPRAVDVDPAVIVAEVIS
jgi:hypothetical protein